MDIYMGFIWLFGGTYAPRGNAFCAGQLVPLAQNSALFSLLGVTYGGNGSTTFALPDLRSRTAIGAGQGPGLSSYALGQVGGTEVVTLNSTQIPPHSHPVYASSVAPTAITPANNFLTLGANLGSGPNATTLKTYAATAGTPTALNAATIGQPVGGGQAHENRSPYLALNYCILMEGIYPSRN